MGFQAFACRARRRRSTVTAPLSAALGAALVTALLPSSARAEEPITTSEPRLMSETAEVTSVVDAFDRDDPFDLNITLGFNQRFKHTDIRRETNLDQPGLSTGHFVAATENVASYSQSVSTLNFGADVGLYKDLALSLRLPLILADSRQLDDLNGSSKNPQRTTDLNGDQLFSVPFKSPTRSGVDWFGIGIKYDIYNQQRDETKPTWMIGLEGQFAVGPRLHACNDGAPVKCPDPQNPTLSRDPGVSRAMNGINFVTVFSRRFGYLEPYTGFNFIAEFPQGNSDFGETNSLKGALLSTPPIVGGFTLGTEVIPWEEREKFQRLIIDFRAKGEYHSPGREYSELFDALGSSQARSLRAPNPGGYVSDGGSGSIVDKNANSVYFTGITDQDGFATLGGLTSVTWQAGEYVKFTAGGGLTFAQQHFITAAQFCNPNFTSDPSQAGPCHGVVNGGNGPQPVTGIPNPNQRASIDTPGHRFSADNTTIVDLFLQGVVMF
jgi:hypothetical protein